MNTSASSKVSFNRFLHQALLLILITVILGSASLRTLHMSPGKTATSSGINNRKWIETLHQTYIEPYISAWKKVVPPVTSCTATFWQNTCSPLFGKLYIPRVLSSIALH